MPTRAQFDETLVGPAPNRGAGLVGTALAATGFIATGDSPIAALSPAISAALLACGITPADVTAPGDADLASLAGTNWIKSLDIAWYLLLRQTALGFIGGVKQITFEDYSKEYYEPSWLKDMLKDMREDLKIRWGYGAGTITGGNIDLGFVQTDPCMTERIWPWG